MKAKTLLFLGLAASGLMTSCGKYPDPVEPANIDGYNEESGVLMVGYVPYKMVPVEGGTFTMGAPEQAAQASDNAKPAHQVTLSSYRIGETEVTQALWMAVMGRNPSYFNGDNRPVEEVSWDDCQEFIAKLNALTGKRFRLPTEAEWEFAARGGNKSHGYMYSGSDDADEVGWHEGNADGATHAVGQKLPNELGLYDMCGNVQEWCQDWYGGYDDVPQTNPTGPESGSAYGRVYRDGFFFVAPYRVYDRGSGPVASRAWCCGLRLALSE